MSTSTFDIEKIVLAKGNHTSAKQGMCIMEAVAVYRGLPFSDQPTCVDPVLRSISIRINDTVNDATRQRLKPYIFKLVGTAGQSRETHENMALVCADRAIHVFAPIGLRVRGFEVEAAELEALPAVTDEATAIAAGDVARKVREKLYDSAAASAANAAAAADSAANAAFAAANASSAAANASAAFAYDERINDERFRLLDDLIALCAKGGA